MSTRVHDGTKTVRIEVHVDVDGFVFLQAFDDKTDVRLDEIPRMTPAGASRVARELDRAAMKMSQVR